MGNTGWKPWAGLGSEGTLSYRIGDGSVANGLHSIALGANSTIAAGVDKGVIVGPDNSIAATAIESIVVGHDVSLAGGTSNLVVGNNVSIASVNTTRTVVIGSVIPITNWNENSVTIGHNILLSALGSDNVTIGYIVQNDGFHGVCVGRGSRIIGDDSTSGVSIGFEATCKTDESNQIAIGCQPMVWGFNCIAIGTVSTRSWRGFSCSWPTFLCRR